MKKTSLESDIDENAKAICSSSNRFTQQRYVQLSSKSEKENLILSGFSLSTVTAMIFLAARDEASEEIQKCFQFPEDLEKHKLGYKDMLAHLAKCNSEYAKLIISQKIFVSNKLDVPELFTEDIQKFFGADCFHPTQMDYPASAVPVNDWVNEATTGKIESIVTGNDFNQDNLLLLLNAIFFKCDWEKKVQS